MLAHDRRAPAFIAGAHSPERCSRIRELRGRLAQLVRAPALQAAHPKHLNVFVGVAYTEKPPEFPLLRWIEVGPNFNSLASDASPPSARACSHCTRNAGFSEFRRLRAALPNFTRCSSVIILQTLSELQAFRAEGYAGLIHSVLLADT